MEAFFFWDQDVYVSRAKVEETGSKNSASGSFGVIVKMPLLFLPSTLGPMDSDLEKQHHMLDTDLEPGPRPETYYHYN